MSLNLSSTGCKGFIESVFQATPGKSSPWWPSVTFRWSTWADSIWKFSPVIFLQVVVFREHFFEVLACKENFHRPDLVRNYCLVRLIWLVHALDDSFKFDQVIRSIPGSLDLTLLPIISLPSMTRLLHRCTPLQILWFLKFHWEGDFCILSSY